MTAFTPDWQRVERTLAAFLRARGVQQEDADEVLQNALLRILHGLDQLRAPEAFDAFVFQTTRFALADHFRRAPRDRAGSEPADEPVDTRTEPDDSGDDAGRARAALAAWLGAEVERLPEPLRTTLKQTELEGRPYREIAEAEGVSLSAVKSRVARGRKELKRRLQRCCEVKLDARKRVTDFEARAKDRCGC